MPKVEKAKKEYVPTGKVYSFYGGKAMIEVKPWGDHYRFIRLPDKTGGLLSATACTKYLDKSRALIPWAVGLVGAHIRTTFESRTGEHYSKDEIYLVLNEALLKPEEKKVKGGQAGDIIHDYAHDFAKAVIAKTALPKFDHLDEKDEVQGRALNGINAFLTWYNAAKKVEFMKMEEPVYYNSLLSGDTKEGEPVIEFSGILDLVAKVNGQIEVIDYKSSKGIYSDQRYQVSAYFKGYNPHVPKELRAKGTRILNFSKDTGDLIEKFMPIDEVEKDFRAFVGLQMVATREAELDKEYRDGLKAATMKE